MENIHGVDVSWLHRPTNDHNTLISPPSSNPTSPPSERKEQDTDKKSAEIPKTNGVHTAVEEVVPLPLPTQTQAQPAPKSQASKRPGLLSRSPSEKSSDSAQTIPKDKNSPGRKTSWMASLSSKLSSQKSSASKKDPPQDNIQAQQKSAPSSAVPIPTNDRDSRRSFEKTSAIEEEDTASYSPASPKPSGSFLSSALRRLSNNSMIASSPSDIQALQTHQVERMVLNVDQGRDRCAIKGLNQAKLRRVSFSVDVEIAGCSRYSIDEDSPKEILLVQKAKADKKKEMKKLKERSEGEALKHPEAIKDEVKDDGVIRIDGKILDDFPSPYGNVPGRRKSAVDNSQYMHVTPQKIEKKPIQQPRTKSPEPKPKSKDPDKPDNTMNHSTSDVSEAQPSTAAKPADSLAPGPSQPPQDRPTTDPLRVYRRCCQLREAPVLKRISEQLGSPSNCGVEAPGVVTCLNLNRSRMQLPDIVCLGDFLALVPVKKILFDYANLTDEGVRVILAGLLAAKLPELHKRKRGRSSPTRLRSTTIHRSPGVIEKLTFKGNQKLTAEAWHHICLFLNLCKSIKAVDFSMIPFPTTKQTTDTTDFDDGEVTKESVDIAELLCQSLTGRLGGDTLAELTFAACGLDDYQVSKIVDGATQMRLRRLGLAGNFVSGEGLKHIAEYVKSGSCTGLDLGGLNVHKNLPTILDALTENCPLQAISLANSNLDASELKPLFESLVRLPDLRFIDLSHNRKLFSTDKQPKALPVLRQYMPQLKLIKRFHLMDVNLTTADAIGIAEIVPEVRNLAHLNILENPQLTAVANATDAAASEEACALYASLMTAVRLSKTMVCVDIDVPSKASSEVVRALARQVVAYCLRNLELFAQGDAIRVADAAAALPDISDADTGMLADIVGRSENGADAMSLPASAKNEDYLMGGQGWVKALNHCLNAADLRRISADGSSTPTQVLESEGGKAQAKEMSKDLLLSARNFRQRLQSVIAREEAATADYDVMKRLTFLDSTIKSIIERFEVEYPECRPSHPSPPSATLPDLAEIELVDPTSLSPSAEVVPGPYEPDVATPDSPKPNDRDFSRRGSATDLASFAQAKEEATFHRFGQKFRRDVLPPTGTEDRLHGTRADDPPEQEHNLELRRRLEQLGGDELRDKVNRIGWEATLRDFKEEKDRLMKEGVNGGRH